MAGSMKNADWLFWGAWAALVVWLTQKSRVPGTVAPDAWSWTFTGIGFDPNYIPPPPLSSRNVAVANRTDQATNQGGTRSPTVIDTQVQESAAGNPYAGVPFIY